VIRTIVMNKKMMLHSSIEVSGYPRKAELMITPKTLNYKDNKFNYFG
jgi:hypothetical protein